MVMNERKGHKQCRCIKPSCAESEPSVNCHSALAFGEKKKKQANKAFCRKAYKTKTLQMFNSMDKSEHKACQMVLTFESLARVNYNSGVS